MFYGTRGNNYGQQEFPSGFYKLMNSQLFYLWFCNNFWCHYNCSIFCLFKFSSFAFHRPLHRPDQIAKWEKRVPYQSWKASIVRVVIYLSSRSLSSLLGAWCGDPL